MPVLARINGVALGGGLELVVGCDLAVAADTAVFGFVEPRLGRLPLDGGIVTLTRQLPMKFAMEILLTGRRFGAADAVRMGVVNEAVPAADLDAAVDRWLEALLACAPLSLRAIKQIVKRTEDLPRREARATRLPALVEVLDLGGRDGGHERLQGEARPGLEGARRPDRPAAGRAEPQAERPHGTAGRPRGSSIAALPTRLHRPPGPDARCRRRRRAPPRPAACCPSPRRTGRA